MVPVCVYIAGGFWSSTRALQVTVLQVLSSEKKDIWHPFWLVGECQHEHISRWTKCSQPQSNTERMTTKIETFRRASAFALGSASCCCKDFPALTPALSVVKLILIEL